MPFTLAHAAAALPFRRLPMIVLSAVIVGTLAPDFEYFLRFAPGGGFGHTIPGAFLLSLPLALGVLFIFHVLLKAPLVELFPDGIRLRIRAKSAPFRFGGPRRFVLILVSALVGIATHLFWDMFTHRDMWAADHFPWLREEMDMPVFGVIGHFEILQLLSSVAGILLLCIWFAHWYRTTVPVRDDQAGLPASRRYLILGGIAAVGCVGGMIRAGMMIAASEGDPGWVVVAGDCVSTAIALSWWVLVLYAMVVMVRKPAGSRVGV